MVTEQRNANTKNHYDIIQIPLDALMDKTSVTIDDYFYLKDLEQRKLYLTSEIEQASVEEIIHSILQFNKEDKEIPPENRTPILLYISSPGGEVISGNSLIDAIICSKTPIYTINFGMNYSMAFLIGIAGHKRYAFKNSTWLMHDGAIQVWDSTSKAKDMMTFQKNQDEKIKKFVLDHTKISSKMYNSKLREEWYFDSEMAKKYGIVDYIIGEEAELDDII